MGESRVTREKKEKRSQAFQKRAFSKQQRSETAKGLRDDKDKKKKERRKKKRERDREKKETPKGRKRGKENNRGH